MREKAVRFGKSAVMVGIVSEATGGRDPSRPAIVLLNSGILHHVGSCRFHVKVARRLAAAGYTVMRFDHSGIGDSEPRKDTLPFVQSAVLEAKETMDYLESTQGAKQFVLMGLCSGADMAFKVAGADPRVVGVVQLDAFAYRTPGYWLHHYGSRLTRASSWKSLLGRLARSARKPAASTAPGGVAEERDPSSETPNYRRTFPPREAVEADLRTLVQRGVNLFFIFSAGQEQHINHQAQYRQSFRSLNFRDLLRVEYLAEADHLFTGLEHQEFVAAETLTWMQRIWPSRTAAAGAPVTAPSAAVASRVATPVTARAV